MGLDLPVKANAKQHEGVELFDGSAIRRDLTALARAAGGDRKKLRDEALVLIRGSFNAARAQIRERVDAGISPGLAAARSLSALQDVTIQVIYDFAVKHFYYAQNPTSAEKLAVVATGGYGRGLLAPGSDIDLLFVRPYKQTAWCESVIEFILYMLWDLGLKVGHATRSRAECVRLAKQDITIRTSLLEARYLWGDAELYAEIRTAFWKEIATGSGRDFVEAKLAERDTRHLRQGESRYLVEPNVKEGKGGLRDLQTLYWIGKYLYRVEDAADLVDHGVFTKEEYKTFQKAEAFLWDVRCHLHYLAGRAEERISFDVQPELAKRMGYVDPNQHHAVERFMRSYFLVAKDVGDLTRIFCSALEEQSRKERPMLTRLMPGFLKLRSGSEDFYVEHGRLRARDTIFREDPVNLLRVFHIADAKRVDIHPATLRTVTRSLELVDDRLRRNPDANRLFLDLISSRHDPETALRRMNEAGVLGRFMPEFGRVVALMQFNMYHHYTVDEHHLRALGNIASLERGDFKKDHPLASDVIKRIKSREVLYVAILLHDIAKGLPGDHSKVGAVIAEAIAPRLGLSPEDTSLVSWLVLNHLFMSDTAQRRDVSDPKTVQDFVRVVQTPERLRLLLLLTVADIRAVGPGVWNAWKGQLLRELYLESETQMSGGESSPARSARIADAQQKLVTRIADLPENTRHRALTRHYDPYWLAFDESVQEFHARLMAEADTNNEGLAVGARDQEKNAVTEIVVYAGDHPGLFSRLAGAISVTGGSIVDAKIFTTTDGFALDVFYVQDAEGAPFGEPQRLQRLKRTIAKTLAGEILPRTIFAKRPLPKRTAAFRVNPRVIFDNEASNTATVIEVDGPDRSGLLYEITRSLFEAGLSISSSMIATYGERAVDVFYVRDGFGHKLVDKARLAALQERLLKVMENEAETQAAAE